MSRGHAPCDEPARAPRKHREAARSVTSSIHLTVNGIERDVEVGESTTLLDFIRDDLHLTGTKECCDLGECGACTLLVD
ncbi:MAG: 2Fe-2S iron-sulfur cluster binding domain-containing protein, partial [Chloroflexi bacterium]